MNRTGSVQNAVIPSNHTAHDIAGLRRRFGVSQSRFAPLLLCSVRSLSDYEQGRRKPPEEIRVRARELSEFADLLGGLMPPESVPAWLDAPLPALGQRTPVEVIRTGEIGRLYRLLLGYADAVAG